MSSVGEATALDAFSASWCRCTAAGDGRWSRAGGRSRLVAARRRGRCVAAGGRVAAAQLVREQYATADDQQTATTTAAICWLRLRARGGRGAALLLALVPLPRQLPFPLRAARHHSSFAHPPPVAGWVAGASPRVVGGDSLGGQVISFAVAGCSPVVSAVRPHTSWSVWSPVLVTGFPAAAFGTNCYVVAPEAGRGVRRRRPGHRRGDQLDEVLSEHRLQPVAVLLTHGHLDHTFSVAPVCGARDVPAYIHPHDRELLADPVNGCRRSPGRCSAAG